MLSPICRTISEILFPVILLYAAYLASNGHLTPGGAFPAGVILASAILLIYLSRLDHPIEALRSAERAENAVVPLIILIVTISLIEVFIGPEIMKLTPGNMFSALEILSLNVLGTIKVAGSMVMMIVAFFLLGRQK